MHTGSEADELAAIIDSSIKALLDAEFDRSGLRSGAGASLWKAFADLGLLSLALPEEDGGAAMGGRGVTRIARTLGAALAPDPFVAQAVMPACLIAALPPDSTRTDLRDALVSGGTRISLAWQERPDQIDPWPVDSRVGPSGVTGAKRSVCDADVVFFTAMDGDCAVLALGRVPPGRVAPERTLSGGRVADLPLAILEDAQILLRGDAAVQAVSRCLDLGALATAAQLHGISGAAFDLTVEHLKTRVQFGQTIGGFQALQHRAVDLFMALSLAGASVEEAARCFETMPDTAKARLAISAAKARASDTAQLVAREAIQMHGAIGFTEEADIGLYVRAALTLIPAFGSARHHRRRLVALDALELKDA